MSKRPDQDKDKSYLKWEWGELSHFFYQAQLQTAFPHTRAASHICRISIGQHSLGTWAWWKIPLSPWGMSVRWIHSRQQWSNDHWGWGRRNLESQSHENLSCLSSLLRSRSSSHRSDPNLSTSSFMNQPYAKLLWWASSQHREENYSDSPEVLRSFDECW